MYRKVTYSCIVIVLSIFCSCQKTDVFFKDTSVTEDPNITYWDNYAVSLSTYKLDTFATSNDSVLVVGTHTDPLFGKLTAETYAEIVRPASHPFTDPNVIFDSAAIVLVPNGNYYGDTTLPFTLRIYTLAENLGTDTASATTYYNTNTTAHHAAPIGTLRTYIKPGKKDSVFIKLADDFGRDLFNQMQNATDVTDNQASFRSYLKGICITSDSLANDALYQFSTTGSTAIIRIFYTLKGLYNENKFFDLSYNPVKQYNHLGYTFSGSAFNAFSPLKSTIVESSRMDDKALLSNYIPSLVKIEFPDISDIVQTNTYVKVIKATLEIRVNNKLNAYPYFLPPALLMYESNQNNELNSYLVSAGTGYPQTGNLIVNPLIENGTTYSYDITSYINTILTEGRLSTRSLFLSTYSNTYNSQTSRLALSALPNDPDVRLKLYVLGL